MDRHGGLLTADDLAGCRAPTVRRPWSLEAGARILTTPPPGGGAQLLLGLQLLQRVQPHGPLEGLEHRYALLAEVIYTVLRERVRQSSLPARSTGPAEDWLPDEEHIGTLSAGIAQAVSEVPISASTRPAPGEGP